MEIKPTGQRDSGWTSVGWGGESTLNQDARCEGAAHKHLSSQSAHYKSRNSDTIKNSVLLFSQITLFVHFSLLESYFEFSMLILALEWSSLILHIGFRAQVVFVRISAVPIDVILTEIEIQHITWCTEVVWKWLGSVFWGNWPVFLGRFDTVRR